MLQQKRDIKLMVTNGDNMKKNYKIEQTCSLASY